MTYAYLLESTLSDMRGLRLPLLQHAAKTATLVAFSKLWHPLCSRVQPDSSAQQDYSIVASSLALLII